MDHPKVLVKNNDTPNDPPHWKKAKRVVISKWAENPQLTQCISSHVSGNGKKKIIELRSLEGSSCEDLLECSWTGSENEVDEASTTQFTDMCLNLSPPKGNVSNCNQKWFMILL